MAIKIRPRGWDGTIRGNLRAASGGDNTPIIKGSALGGMALRHKHKGWDGLVYGNHRLRHKGWDGTVKGSTRFADQDCDGFVARVTDPRGNVTTADYDAQANIVWRMRKRPELLYQAWEQSFAYDTHGQLTAVTNAPDANAFLTRECRPGWQL